MMAGALMYLGTLAFIAFLIWTSRRPDPNVEAQIASMSATLQALGDEYLETRSTVESLALKAGLEKRGKK